MTQLHQSEEERQTAQGSPPPQGEQDVQVRSARRAKPGSAMDILKSLSGSAGVVTGLAFISGWLYWATYYAAFGLNPLVLDFPIGVVAVSPVQVLLRDLLWDWNSRYYWAAVMILATLICCAALSGLFAHWSAHGRRNATLPLFALALVMSAGGVALGYNDAATDSGCQSKLPNVAFLLSAPPSPADAPATCLNNQMTCKLVLHSNNTYHYFENPDCTMGGTTAGEGLDTAEILDSQVQMVRIQRHIAW